MLKIVTGTPLDNGTAVITTIAAYFYDVSKQDDKCESLKLALILETGDKEIPCQLAQLLRGEIKQLSF